MAGKIEWRPVPGFERYNVSSAGMLRVVGVDAIGRRRYMRHETSGYLNARGYRHVYLSPGDGSSVLRAMHRVVLEAFVGPPPKGHIAKHLDGDKLNCHVGNLEWATRSDVCRHVLALGHRPVRGEAHWSATISDAEIRTIREKRAAGQIIPAIAAEIGKTKAWVCQVCTGRTRASAGGPLTRTSRFKGH